MAKEKYNRNEKNVHIIFDKRKREKEKEGVGSSSNYNNNYNRNKKNGFSEGKKSKLFSFVCGFVAVRRGDDVCAYTFLV